jgi:hypothetical protein
MNCAQCKREIDALEVFPGGLCLTCWEPIGEARFRAMSAEDLAVMWGAKRPRQPRRRRA